MTPEDARHHARAHRLAAARLSVPSTTRYGPLQDVAYGYEALAKELEAEQIRSLDAET